MSNTRRRRAVLACALALLVVLTVSACGGGGKLATPPAPSIAATPTDPEITATGLPDGTEVELTDSAPGVENGTNLDFVSPVLTVTPLGPLDAAATITLRLNNALPATTPLLVASRESEKEPWTYRRGRLTSDQRHLEFKTRSLDQVGVLAIDLDGAMASVRTDVLDGLGPVQAKKAEKPTCEESKTARESGYKVASTKAKTLFWCFGLANEKRVLTITNRKLVPLEVTHTDLKVITEPRKAAAYALWPTVLGTTNIILAPGGAATFDAELEPKSVVQVIAASSEKAQSLRVLQAGTRALVTRLNSFGAGPAKVGPTVEALLAKPPCARSLNNGVDAVVRRCFAQPKLNGLFGSGALMLAPVVSDPSFRVFFSRQGKALTAQAGTLRQRIVARREAPNFSALAGMWSGHTRSLTINAAGLVTERLLGDSGGLVVQMTYQLEDPKTVTGTTTAQAALKEVKVGNRKLLTGRVPRAGDTGKITLSKGVITPPFLRTNYCDNVSAKKGTCGS